MNGFVKSLLISSALVSVMAAPSLEAGKGRDEGTDLKVTSARPADSIETHQPRKPNGQFDKKNTVKSDTEVTTHSSTAQESLTPPESREFDELDLFFAREGKTPALISPTSVSTATISPVLSVSSPTSPITSISGQKRPRPETVITPSPQRARTNALEIFKKPSTNETLNLLFGEIEVRNRPSGDASESVDLSEDAAVPPTQRTLFDDNNGIDPAEFTVAYGEEGTAPSGEEDDRDTFPIPGTPHLTEDVTTSHEVTGTNGTPEPIEPVMAPRQIKPLEITILPINWTFGVSVKINPVPTQPTVLNQAQSHKYILKLSAGSGQKNNQLPSGETDITAAMTDAPMDVLQ